MVLIKASPHQGMLFCCCLFLIQTKHPLQILYNWLEMEKETLCRISYQLVENLKKIMITNDAFLYFYSRNDFPLFKELFPNSP